MTRRDEVKDSGAEGQSAAGMLDPSEIGRRLAAAARPFVIVGERELSVLRRGLTKGGWKRSLYLQDAPPDLVDLGGAGLLSAANLWLSAEISIPAPARRYHDFFCADGTLLERPEKGAGGYRCAGCGRIYSGEKYDAAMRWFEHRELANACLALALVYQIDRDTEYADKAAEIIRRYAEAYPGPGTDGASGGMMSQSVDEAAWLIALAQAYDLIYHAKSLSNHDRGKIEGALLRPAAERLAGLKTTGSRASWHLAAAGVVGCALRNAELLQLALFRFAAQLRDELGDDGIWPEPIYADRFSPLAAFVHLAEACSRVGIDLFNYYPRPGKGLKSMFLAPLGYAYPSFQLPAVNEGWYHSAVPLDLYEVAYRRWRDDIFAWVLRTGYRFSQRPGDDIHVAHRSMFTRSGLYAFLFGRDLPGRIQQPRLLSASCPSMGTCVLRNDANTMLTLDYGPLASDSHLDKLGITLYAKERVMVADYGSPGPGTSVAEYYASTPSHNTVVVDGMPQQRTSESRLAEFQPGNYLQLAQAETEEAYPGVKYVRRVILAGDNALVQDFLASEAEHVYDWLLRCEGQLEGVPEKPGPAQAVSSYFVDAVEAGRGSDFRLCWRAECGGLAAWLASDGPAALIAARCPAETACRAVPVVDLRRKSKSASYAAVLAPYGGEPPVVERFGKAFRVTSGEVVDWIYAADAPGTASPGEIETDAQIAAVRVVGGELAACGLCSGSYIRLRGELLLFAPGVFRWAEARLDSRNPVIAFEGASGGYIRLKCSSRAMRVNAHKVSASTVDGMASIKLVGVLAQS